MDTVSVAWASGLFEGEGCIGAAAGRKGGPAMYLELSIEMADEDIVRHFVAVLKDAGIKGRAAIRTRWRGNENHSRLYSWRITGSEAEKGYALMRPYLGTRRRKRGDEIIAVRRQWVENARASRTCVVCAAEFTPTVHERVRAPVRVCSDKCRARLARAEWTPEQRAKARERSRRYKQRKRERSRIS